MLAEILSNAAQLYDKSHFKRLAIGEHHCLASFRETTTITAYMIACDHQKSFSFTNTDEFTGHVHFSIHVQNYCS